MPRPYKGWNFNQAIAYLDKPYKKEEYSTTEIERFFACSYETIRSLIIKGFLPASRDEEGHYHIFHEDLISFLKQRSVGIENFEGILSEGLVTTRELADHLECSLGSIEYAIREHHLPFINISASKKSKRNPSYRLPRLKTKEILKKLKKKTMQFLPPQKENL